MFGNYKYHIRPLIKSRAGKRREQTCPAGEGAHSPQNEFSTERKGQWEGRWLPGEHDMVGAPGRLITPDTAPTEVVLRARVLRQALAFLTGKTEFS